MLFLTSCYDFSDPDTIPSRVDFFVTVAVTDSDGNSATCGDLGIVRIGAESDDGAFSSCCDAGMDGVILNVRPTSYDAAPITATGYDFLGIGVATGMSERDDGDMDGLVVMQQCDTGCGYFEGVACN